MRFGEYLRKIRKEKGLSLREVGDQLSITFNTLSRWERGEASVDPSLIPELAKALGEDEEALRQRYSEALWSKDLEEPRTRQTSAATVLAKTRGEQSQTGPFVTDYGTLTDWRDWILLESELTNPEKLIALAIPLYRDPGTFVIAIDDEHLISTISAEREQVESVVDTLIGLGLATTIGRRRDVIRLNLPEEFG